MSKKLNTEEFIKRCEEMYPDQYEYTDTVYSGIRATCNIICKEHSSFTTTPFNMLYNKIGCPVCNKERIQRNNKEIISSFISNKKYSVIDCTGVTDTKRVTLNCTSHGEYTTTVGSVKNTDYCGCPRCKVEVKGNLFIKEATKLHKGKYLYKLEDYNGSGALMSMYCTVHNNYFKQRPSAHMQGQGCPLCGNNSRKGTWKAKQKDYIKIANEKHNNYYDYSKSKFNKYKDKITVTCPLHGDFKVRLSDHIALGIGCKECKRLKDIKRWQDNFITKSKIKFGEDRFDYSSVEYSSNKGLIELTCIKHNETFKITPNSHLFSGDSGGCPLCGKSNTGIWNFKQAKLNYSTETIGVFYTGKISNLDGVKIGVTKDIVSRSSCYRRDLEPQEKTFGYTGVLYTSYVTVFLIESILKEVFAPYNKVPDFNFGGKNEVFDIPEKYYSLLEDIFNGRYDLEFNYLAHTINDTKDLQFKNFVIQLKNKYDEAYTLT